MKKILILIALSGGLLNVLAQDTLQFNANLSGANETPPNNSSLSGIGTFSLTGNSLDFSVLIQPATFPSDAGVYGAGNSLIFDLGTPIIDAPGPNGQPGSVSYSGNASLTAQEITDLESGQGFVNIMTSAFPSGEIRGQISSVPEPSSSILFNAGIGMALLFLRKRKQCRPPTPEKLVGKNQRLRPRF